VQDKSNKQQQQKHKAVSRVVVAQQQQQQQFDQCASVYDVSEQHAVLASATMSFTVVGCCNGRSSSSAAGIIVTAQDSRPNIIAWTSN
jgi:hypothetical protein